MAKTSTLESMEINLKVFQGEKVLVTGATGFVGSHLVEQLVKIGAKTISTFEYIDPKSYFMSQKLHQKTIMVNIDVRDLEDVYDLVSKFKIIYIFHLAAQAIVETAYDNPVRTLESNINGTINVLESARRYQQVKAVIIASSDKAYGKLKKDKYLESDELRGDHPYDVSKSSADLISQMYAKTYRVPVTISRFGNIYGPGDLNFSRLIPGIIEAIIKNERLDLRSDGRSRRDYLWVKDVVRGYLILGAKIKETAGKAYNFGSEENLSVLELVKKVEEITGKKVKYRILNRAKNEIGRQSLNWNRAKKLGWQPESNLKKELVKIFTWYKNNI